MHGHASCSADVFVSLKRLATLWCELLLPFFNSSCRKDQRPGAIVGMKRAELKDAYASRQPGSWSWLIVTVSEYRTGFAESFKIVADAHEEKKLAHWVKVEELLVLGDIYYKHTDILTLSCIAISRYIALCAARTTGLYFYMQRCALNMYNWGQIVLAVALFCLCLRKSTHDMLLVCDILNNRQ